MNIINKLLQIIKVNDKIKNEVLLSVDKIQLPINKIRSDENEEELKKLAISILQNGVIHPIIVRKIAEDNYEVVAGVRRLKACKLANIKEINAVVSHHDDIEASFISLVENIQKCKLDYFDEAKAIRDIINNSKLTDEDVAKKIGISTKTLKNKLRLLAFTSAQEQLCKDANLSEEHARAVLKLASESERTKVIELIINKECNVRQTKEIVNFLIDRDIKPKQRVMVRDVRIFVNTIERAIKLMTDNGIPAVVQTNENTKYVEYTIRIPINSYQYSNNDKFFQDEKIEQVRQGLIDEIERQVNNLQIAQAN